eukprot:gene11799-15012_t
MCLRRLGGCSVKSAHQIYSPSTTTDALCRDCAHMHPDRDGGRWCSSPQILKATGHSIRCVWERDAAPEPERSHPDGTGKYRVEQLLTLRDVEHRSFGEIGHAMGISRNAAIGKYGRVRVRRGLHTPTPRKRILVSVSEGKPEFCKELLYNTTPKRPLTPRRQLPKVATNGIGFLLPILTPPPPREVPAVGILE